MISVAEAVRALESVDPKDPEVAHGAADAVLMAVAPPEVVEAYIRLMERCPWWAAA